MCFSQTLDTSLDEQSAAMMNKTWLEKIGQKSPNKLDAISK